MEFLLTPNNINAFARQETGKASIKQGNDFVFNGDEPIEFEDENATLHFFFPKDYAHAVADSITDFANRTTIKRVLYSQGGKNFMLVGVPWSWINSAQEGKLIIDPTTNAATNGMCACMTPATTAAIPNWRWENFPMPASGRAAA